MLSPDQHPLFKLEQSGTKLTPMMEQYWSIKKHQMDKVLFFRMGDFYEVFFHDAEVCAKLLNITLTHRGKIQEMPIPMAGIPHHAANAYVDKLVQASVKVAICEQIEDPKAAKGIVKRAITQICTPVLPYDLDRYDSKSENYLVSIIPINQTERFWAVAIDFIHGNFKAYEAKGLNDLQDFIEILSPKECLCAAHLPELHASTKKLLEDLGCMITHVSMEQIDSKMIATDLEKLIPNFQSDQSLTKNPELMDILKSIAFYLSATQSTTILELLRPIKIIKKSRSLELNAKTYFHLEILPTKNNFGTDRNSDTSLFHFMNHCLTASGSRLLKEWFTTPLISKLEIQARQQMIKDFKEETFCKLSELRKILGPVRDIARILTKLSTGKIHAQDLINLAQTMQSFFLLLESLKTFHQLGHREIETQQLKALDSLISTTINDDLRASLEKGNLIKEGVNPKRDELSNIHVHIQTQVEQLEEKYKSLYHIPTLKIRSNNLNGYFIEISKGQSTKAPAEFKRIQTLTNGERFMSEELSKIEETLLTSQGKLLQLENEIFQSVKESVFQASNQLKMMSDWLALVDVYQSFADVALKENFACPEFIIDKKFHALGAWHPIIKSQLGGHFVTHNIEVTKEKGLLLITGPNMAGKTTIMREAALIQFLAQLGSFVPAHQCSLSVVDKIFCRVGAHDDIHRGQSTFMVEMSETAEILRHATPESLILFDEIGRGTSTYDGLSIAWSLLEFLASELKCFTFFSTHYHELIELAATLPFAKNMTVKTSTENENLKFLYEFIEGGAKQSFGIKVAHMAGVPTFITKRAETILSQLETHQSLNINLNEDASKEPEKQGAKAKKSIKQYELFPELNSHKQMTDSSVNVLGHLKNLNINHLTPMQALKKLEEWQKNLMN